MNKLSINIGLIRPKSPANVGAVMRAAGCFQANAVFYTGDRYDRAKRFNTDTRKKNLDIPLTGVECLLDNVPGNAKIICVELVEGAISLPDFQHPENAFYIFGPEDGTISQEVVDRADSVVYIPTNGCLNLAATVNVVLYDRITKSPQTVAGDALIRQSRDINNSTQVKAVTLNNCE
jgi:tRNA(Leu) C34 or U34 (ribose-2'-O)-methylase TrmL